MFPLEYKIDNSWRKILNKRCEYWLDDFYKSIEKYQGHSPTKENIFRPLQMNIKDIKIVIIGSEPYINDADGLAFSSNKIKITLKKIYYEIERTLSIKMDYSISKLDYLHEQGILLINKYWTSKKYDINWFSFTSMILEIISLSRPNIIFILCGANAYKLLKYILKKDIHMIITTSHPSDIDKKFTLDFKLINDYLAKNNIKKINFSNTNI